MYEIDTLHSNIDFSSNLQQETYEIDTLHNLI